jgi:ABC-type dipeptide/oligopeptide/nickel transport system permease component
MEKALDAVSLVMGVLSLFFWPIPFAGFVSSIIGLVMGIIANRRRKSRLAAIGMILSGIGLLITLVNLRFNLIDILLKKYFQH